VLVPRLGRERIETAHHLRPERIRPVRNHAGTLGGGLP
jgi:hypothetical protein